MIKKSTTVFVVILTAIVVFVSTLFLSTYFELGQKIFSVSRQPESLDIKKIENVINIIDSYYVNEYDKEALTDGAAEGIVQALEDPFSDYMSKEEFTEAMESTSNSYGGIGVLVTVTEEDNLITVISPFEGTPAAQAGILPGDKIIKVDGVEVNGENLNKAVNLMKGPPATSVMITVIRANNNIKDINIKRDIIKVAKVTNKIYEDNIGYIRIPRFYGDCSVEFNNTLDELLEKNIEGLIIDVRNNPGGLVNEVSVIADRLVPKGVIISAKDKYGNEESIYSDEQELDIPIVLLVNEGSASASEILAISLKEYEKGILLGEKTFGKGVIQTVIPLDDGSGISITSAKYFSKEGTSYHGVGIEPDVKVELDITAVTNIWDMKYEEDTQLQKAVKILLEKK